MRSYLPDTDQALLAWSLNFKTIITAGPVPLGLTAALATNYGTLHDSYATALAACDPGLRTKSAVSTKNDARKALKNNARLLASIINGQADVTDAQKLELGLTVRSHPQPRPVPPTAPILTVKSVKGWTVRVKLEDAAGDSKRARPPFTSGASIFSHIGETAPADINSWTFEGNCGKTTVDVVFDSSLPGGTKVWLCAFWFNGRKQSGAACDAVPATLQGGAVQTESA